MKNETQEYSFYSKISKIICLSLLIIIPIIIYILVINFHIFGLMFLLFYSIINFILIYHVFSNKVIIEKDKITFIQFKKYIFIIKNIVSIDVNRRSYIEIIYNDKIKKEKKYLFVGYVFLDFPNREKNLELVEKLTKLLPKKRIL